jgi:hypothetical protein
MKITYFQLKLFNFFYVATNCECSICYNQGLKYYTNPCYNIIRWFFSKVQISTNYEKIILKFVVLCLTLAEPVPGIILLFAKEITCVKRIILESYRQCAKDLLMICTKIYIEWDEFLLKYLQAKLFTLIFPKIFFQFDVNCRSKNRIWRITTIISGL